nr:hypothetical protein [Tanacetum cinerariifolium]
SVTNGSCLDDGRVCREMGDEFAPPKFFASVREMKHDQLFTEFNVRVVLLMSLSAEYNVKENRRLKSVVERQGELLTVREKEIENLKAQLLLREAEAAEAIHLCVEASNFEAVEKSFRDETNALRERNAILEKEKNALDVKVTELETSSAGKEPERTGLNAPITSIKSRNDSLVDRVHELEISSSRLQEKVIVWLLTQGMELAIIKCLNSPEYLSVLRAIIGKAIKKSIVTVLDILRLEGPLVEKLGLDELQPNVNQLMVPVHHSSDKVVIGATALSLSLDVFSIRVRKIKENIANHISALRDIFVPLADPFSAVALIDDYEVIGVDDQAVADGDSASFLNEHYNRKFLGNALSAAYLTWKRMLPLRPLSLYAPLPKASLTSYGPSHLGPSLPPSFAWLASLFW